MLDRFADGLSRAVCDEKYEYLRPMTLFDGDGIAIRVTEREDKKIELSVGMAFSERFRYVSFYGDAYIPGFAERIDRLCRLLGVTYDRRAGELTLLFRRNEMRIGEAYFKLVRAVSVLLEVGGIVFP